MTRLMHCMVPALVTLLVGASAANAALSFDVVDWNTVGDGDQGWDLPTGDADGTARSTDGLGGEPDGYLQLVFNDNSPSSEIGGMENNDLTVADDYTQYDRLYLAFDLYVDPLTTVQSLYFQTADTSSTWAYTLTGTGGSWTRQSISFASGAGWTRIADSGGDESFSAALGHVGLLGFDFSHVNLGDTYYGLDDFGFGIATIPEPGTMAMALTLLSSVGLTMRKRIRGIFTRRTKNS